MTINGLTRWLKPFSATIQGTRRSRKPRPRFRPGGEALEQRMLLAAPPVVEWTGGARDNPNWSAALNWSGGAVPVAGDSLVFPAGALQETNNNDLATNIKFSSITFEGAGYDITGNAVTIGPSGTITDTGAGASLIGRQHRRERGPVD